MHEQRDDAIRADAEDREEALEVLRGARRVLLTGHERPDGDCVGAQAALARVLEALGKTAFILNPDPLEGRYDYLAKDCPYRTYTGGAVPEHDLTVLLDCSELSRCGKLAPVLERHPSKKLVIDHHPDPGERWWDAAYRDVGASATGLLVHRIARELNVPLDDVAASGVFTSIVTDTGWFRYSNTNAETFAVAAELVAAGVDPAQIYRAVFQRRSREHPKRVGEILGGVEYFADGRLAVVDVPLDGQRNQGFESDDVLDLLRAVGHVEVVLLIRELDDGSCKLSARSKTAYDVNRLARRFGGGGHVKASGATLKGKLADVRSELIAAAVAGFDEREG